MASLAPAPVAPPSEAGAIIPLLPPSGAACRHAVPQLHSQLQHHWQVEELEDVPHHVQRCAVQPEAAIECAQRNAMVGICHQVQEVKYRCILAHSGEELPLGAGSS